MANPLTMGVDDLDRGPPQAHRERKRESAPDQQEGDEPHALLGWARGRGDPRLRALGRAQQAPRDQRDRRAQEERDDPSQRAGANGQPAQRDAPQVKPQPKQHGNGQQERDSNKNVALVRVG
jgi:hypothetical protein